MIPPRQIATGRGPAHAHLYPAAHPRALLVLGHGAGRGTDTADLQYLAAVLPSRGITVVLVDQPWVVSGRRVAAPATHLDQAWTEVIARLRADEMLPPGRPLVVGGRSTGARVACRTAAAVDAQALLLLAFPLRPPVRQKAPALGAPGSAAIQVRLREWAQVRGLPVVLVQGGRDRFGDGADVVQQVAGHGLVTPELVAIPGADHGLAPRRGASVAEIEAALLTAALRAVELAGMSSR